MRHQTAQIDEDYLELTHITVITAGGYPSFYLLSLFPWRSDHALLHIECRKNRFEINSGDEEGAINKKGETPFQLAPQRMMIE
jgi:hypothetical protein